MDKKELLIQAALVEFSEKGFEAASTNQITRNAGVSKGILFHYFQDKKSLYLEVLDDCLQFVLDQVEKHIPTNKDFFDMLLEISAFKMKLFQEQPQIHTFLNQAFQHPVPELQEELVKRYEDFQKLYAPLIQKVRENHQFREDVPSELLIDFVLTSLEAMTMKNMKQGNQGNLEMYIELLKNGVLRKGE